MVMNDFQDVDDDGKQVRLFKEAAEKVNNFFSSNVRKMFFNTP
jgi:hypothetical protein